MKVINLLITKSPVLIDNSLVVLMLIAIAWVFIKAVDHDDDSDNGALT